MPSNDEVMQSMRGAGVPLAALRTTLPRQGADALREYLSTGSYKVAGGGYRGVFVHPKLSADGMRARMVFHVLAKEMVLFGESVYCLSLARLIEALSSDEGSTDFERANSASIVFIADFYERGAPFPLQPWQAGVFRSWVKDKFESGGAVCLLSDSPWKQSETWWPPSFTGFLMEHTRTFSIG